MHCPASSNTGFLAERLHPKYSAFGLDPLNAAGRYHAGNAGSVSTGIADWGFGLAHLLSGAELFSLYSGAGNEYHSIDTVSHAVQ